MASMPPGSGGGGVGGSGGANAGFALGFVLAAALVPACIGLAWPITLIFLLRSASVRNYYHSVRA